MNDNSIYQAVWRWHFFAGLAVLPFLLWLAVTGSLYLFKPEIEAVVYRTWSSVTPNAAPAPLHRLITVVERQGGARVVQVMRPAAVDASWRMTTRKPDGTRQLVFVDPYQATVLGSTSDGGIMQTVRNLHSLIITGPIGNALIEIVAGWAVLLVLSGLYLWWPRRGSPVIGLRGRTSGRLFWRDLHASVGLIAAAVILFLAITGMPWSGIAGRQLQSWVAASGAGRPKPPSQALREGNGHHHDAQKTLPWSLQEAVPPTGHGTGDIGPDRVAAIAESRGLAAPWTMTMPERPGAPYLVSKTIIRAEDARAIYVDADGGILQDVGYAQFGAGARTIEWGIATHQGQEYGQLNRLLMLAGCIAIMILAVTAPVLWWKRRRNSRLEVPPRSADPRKARGVAGLMLLVGALFPLTGLSMIAVLAADLLIGRIRRALA